MSWHPSMAEYHAAPGISASYLSAIRREGYSTALLSRMRPQGSVETERLLVMGEAAHCLLQGLTPRIHVCHSTVKRRAGNAWKEEVARAERLGYRGILLAHEWATVQASLASVRNDLPYPSEAKRQIRLIAQAPHLERWPELSHRWRVLEGPPELWCKVRPDFVVRLPGGRLIQAPIKTTRTSLRPEDWWPFWRRYHLISAAFHWAGMLDCYGVEVPQLWIVGRMTAPYPWAIYNISEPGAGAAYLGGISASELIREAWESQVLPELRSIHRCMIEGLVHGPEEGGFQ